MRNDMADLLANRADLAGPSSGGTRVGNLLRRCSLDELPQLFDVLRGEMSLVGPRPHAQHDGRPPLHDMVADYAMRHRVKPGITGWAQVNGSRGEMPDAGEQIRERVSKRLQYIRNWNLLLDCNIVLTVLREVLSSRAF